MVKTIKLSKRELKAIYKHEREKVEIELNVCDCNLLLNGLRTLNYSNENQLVKQIRNIKEHLTGVANE